MKSGPNDASFSSANRSSGRIADQSRNNDSIPFDVKQESASFDIEESHLGEVVLDENDETVIAASEPFVGQWNRLISRTNWDKGRIIVEWRQAVASRKNLNADADAAGATDDAWSRQVGGVTPQHVGRLRRVYERFSNSYESFKGLYWSHFLAALDWSDAEMWLEGAVQSDWSVSQMRKKRWETLGGDPALKPREQDIISGEIDEDFQPLTEASAAEEEVAPRDFASSPLAEGPDFGESEWEGSGDVATEVDAFGDTTALNSDAPSEKVYQNPFVDLPTLPADIAEAMELFKLAIARHRSSNWAEVSQNDVVKAVVALKIFAELS